jgi:hypothetical protein
MSQLASWRADERESKSTLPGDWSRQSARSTEDPVVVTRESPNGWAIADDVLKRDAAEDDAPRKRLFGEFDVACSCPGVWLSPSGHATGMNPQTSSVVRHPRAVLDVLAGEDRRRPRLPDGQHRLAGPTSWKLIPA